MKAAVVYFSSTGNTEAMAKAVMEGLKKAGVEAELFQSSEFKADMAADYDAFAFGCSAMGAEELEDTEFAPMFDAVEPLLKGKKTVLFGSYGWGDGEWMRNWEERCKNAGIVLASDFVICQEAPDADAIKACEDLAASLA